MITVDLGCKKDIQMYCHNQAQQQSKPQIVHCLSERIRNAVLSESSHDISDVCRAQVNFELLSESEDVRLRPEIIRACALDIKVHCNDVKPGSCYEVKIALNLFVRSWQNRGVFERKER